VMSFSFHIIISAFRYHRKQSKTENLIHVSLNAKREETKGKLETRNSPSIITLGLAWVYD